MVRGPGELPIGRGHYPAAKNTLFFDLLLPRGLGGDLVADDERPEGRRAIEGAAPQEILNVAISLIHLVAADIGVDN